MKKTISFLLALIMLVMTLPVNVMAASYKDVSDSDYYAEALKKLSEDKILEGYPDGTFGAKNDITRAEMTAVVCRMINKELKTENPKSAFTDVADDHWAIAYISAASEAKIINGDGDGTFRPEDCVMHEEAIKMVVCALGFVEKNIQTDPADWSASYLEIAREKGVSANLIGKKGEKSTRGDVTVMVYNGIIAAQKDASEKICKQFKSVLSDIENINSTIGFSDTTAGVMAYVKKNLELALDDAENKGIIITNEYVLEKYSEDINAVKSIINNMTPEEMKVFKDELLTKISLYSLTVIGKFFGIDIASYL